LLVADGAAEIAVVLVLAAVQRCSAAKLEHVVVPIGVVPAAERRVRKLEHALAAIAALPAAGVGQGRNELGARCADGYNSRESPGFFGLDSLSS
jgi:hypothetical protein